MDFSGIAEWLGTLDAGAVVGALFGAGAALFAARTSAGYQRRREEQARVSAATFHLVLLIERLATVIQGSSTGEPAGGRMNGWTARDTSRVQPASDEVQRLLLEVDLHAGRLQRRMARQVRQETGDLIARVMLMERELILGNPVSEKALEWLSADRLVAVVFGGASDVPSQRWDHYVKNGLEAAPPAPIRQPRLRLSSRISRWIRSHSGGRG